MLLVQDSQAFQILENNKVKLLHPFNYSDQYLISPSNIDTRSNI